MSEAVCNAENTADALNENPHDIPILLFAYNLYIEEDFFDP